MTQPTTSKPTGAVAKLAENVRVNVEKVLVGKGPVIEMCLAAIMAGCGLAMTLVDYVPCYRSEAGTGNAMAFAYWS